MKVLMINGSPRAKGCTFTALSEIADQLKRKVQIVRSFSWEQVR